MSRVDGRVGRGQKAKLKNLLSAKNKVFGVAESRQKNNFNLKICVAIFLSLAMSSKLDINNSGNFKVSSKLDTGIWRTARAATSTTTTIKLKDLSIGGVINLGAYNYVKIADNQFMQTEVAACPDGKIVAGKYVKCFEDSSVYTQTCTGSYYCNTSNTSWNSSTGKCDSSVTCPNGSTYCGDNSSWDATSSKCVGTAGSSSCGSGTTWDSASSTCTSLIPVMQDWTGCSNLNTNATISLYDTAASKFRTIKKFADGNCYTYEDISTSSGPGNATKALCSNISGWSLPTQDQFEGLVSAVGKANMNSVWCGGQCSSARYWWSSTDTYLNSGYFSLYVSSSDAAVNAYKLDTNRVRCIKN